MDMPEPVSAKNWKSHLARITKTTMDVAEVSMRRAAKNIQQDISITDVTVSCDGTWQKRGFSSKNGVATVVSVDGKNCKVLDKEVLSNYCNTCANMKAKFNNEGQFSTWYDSHKSACAKNHTGSAGLMEPIGMERIFRRSIKNRKLRYTGYLGDGDSKSYAHVSSALPPIYPQKKIEKLECCGHVQKRMGRRLMDMVQQCKNKVYTV